MSVTSADVARRAGVSRATVSYVLNATAGQAISPRTRRLVLAAAAELGYRPNPVARSLRRGRSDSVVCPLPGLRLTYPLALLVETCAAALEREGLFLVPDFTRRSDPTEQLAAWQRLAPAAVLDILLRHDDPVLPALRAAGIPVLSANLPQEPAWETAGDVFAREQRLTQIRHLLDIGRRNIAAVLPPQLDIDARAERTFLRRLRTAARAGGARLRVERVDLEPVAIRAAVERWVAGGTTPDAVAAHNDDYAIALMAAMQAYELAVPADVAVMGIDDIPLGRVHTPTLTTVRGEFEQFATAAAAAVVASVSGGGRSQPLPVPTHSVVRRESA